MLSKLLKLNVAGAGCKLGVQVNPIQTGKAFGGEPLESPPPHPLSQEAKKSPGGSANRRNNSYHCWANNVASCYVGGVSGVQTDATTPTMFGPVVHRGKDTTHKTL